MKKSIFFSIIIAGIFLRLNNSYAQQTSEKEYKFTIKTNPLAALGGPFWVIVLPVTGEYKAYFETAVSQKTSFQVGASFLGPSVLINLDEISKEEGNELTGIKTGGYRIQGTFKYFISRDLNAPEGFYIGPNISYASVTIKNKENPDDKINGKKLNISGLFGYQMITSGGFTLDIFMGMGYVSRKYDIDLEGSFDPEDFKSKGSVTIPFGFAFGYAF